MKRVLLLLLVASLAQAQVQTIQWSKVSGRDTVFMAGSLWGISTKFVTFKDGSYMSSAAGFSDTTKYLEWADSAATAGWVTREKFRLDTTYKAAQLLLRVLYTDSGTTYSSFAQFRDSLANARSRYVWKPDSGVVYASFPQFRDTTASARSRYVWKPDSGIVYMSWPQGRDSLASARSRYVWKPDSGIVYASYPQFRDSLAAHWSQLLLRVLYSDTGTTAAKIPKNWYLYDQIKDSLAEYMLRANPVSTGLATFDSLNIKGTVLVDTLKALYGVFGSLTANPRTPLDVIGASSFSGRLDFYPDGNTTRAGIFGTQGGIGGTDMNNTDLLLKSVGGFGIGINNSNTKSLIIRKSGQILVASGSVSAPSYSFFSDTTAGMYLLVGTALRFAYGGTVSFGITSNGNLTGLGGNRDLSGFRDISANQTLASGFTALTHPGNAVLEVRGLNSQANIAGFYRYGTNGAGVLVGKIDTTGNFSSASLGTAGTPSYGISGITSGGGMYAVSAASLGFSVAGTRVMTVNTTNFVTDVNVVPNSDGGYSIGSETIQWDQIFGRRIDVGTRQNTILHPFKVSKFNGDSVATVDTTGLGSLTKLKVGTIGSSTLATIDSARVQYRSLDFFVGGTRYEAVNLVHGYCQFSDSSRTLDLTQNVWQKVTNSGNNLFSTVEFDGLTFAGDSLTVSADRDGDYFLTAQISFNGNNNDDFEWGIAKNGVLQFKMRASGTGTSNRNIATVQAYLNNLVAGDDLALWVRNVTNNNDVTLMDGNIYMRREHN